MNEPKYQTMEEAIKDWEPTIDLGNGHWFKFMGWAPDRQLNPQYDGIPDVDRYGGVHIHPRPDGNGYCCGSITFDGEAQRKLDAGRPRWNVHSFEPLTLTPSLLCRTCNSHIFITNGKVQTC